jgi:nucleoid-associated protein YgaU
VTEGTTSGAAGTSGTSAGDLASGASNASTGTGAPLSNANNAATGNSAGNGSGAIDARVLADIAAGGSGTAPTGGSSSTGSASSAAPLNTSVNPAGQRTHVVQPNETFASIAAVAYGSQAYYPHLVRANPTVNPKRLRAGMTIVLPDKDQVVAKDAKPAQGAAFSSPSAPAMPGAMNSTATPGATLGNTGNPGATGGAVTVALPPIDERAQYRVQAGESLYKIALKLYGRGDKVNAIYDLNKDAIGPNRNHLKAGMVLKLPEAPTSGATAAR